MKDLIAEVRAELVGYRRAMGNLEELIGDFTYRQPESRQAGEEGRRQRRI